MILDMIEKSPYSSPRREITWTGIYCESCDHTEFEIEVNEVDQRLGVLCKHCGNRVEIETSSIDELSKVIGHPKEHLFGPTEAELLHQKRDRIMQLRREQRRRADAPVGLFVGCEPEVRYTVLCSRCQEEKEFVAETCPEKDLLILTCPDCFAEFRVTVFAYQWGGLYTSADQGPPAEHIDPPTNSNLKFKSWWASERQVS